MSDGPTTLSTTVLALGIGCILAAIVGGGITVFRQRFPTIPSLWRQVLLAAFGVVLCAFVGRATIAATISWLYQMFPITETVTATLEPGASTRYSINQAHVGQMEARIDSIQSSPTGKEVQVYICAAANPSNCKNEQLGASQAISASTPAGDNVVKIFNFASNPAVTVAATIKHTR